MARYIDFHSGMRLPQEALSQIAEEARGGKRDQYGVRTLDVFYNPEGKVFCYLEGPSEESIRQHHAAAGIECHEVTQVECLSCS